MLSHYRKNSTFFFHFCFAFQIPTKDFGQPWTVTHATATFNTRTLHANFISSLIVTPIPTNSLKFNKFVTPIPANSLRLISYRSNDQPSKFKVVWLTT